MLSFLESVKISVLTYLNLKFQFFGAPKINKAVFDKQLISYPYTKKNNQPILLDKKLHWKFELAKEVFYPETFITVLKRGRVWGNEGFIISAQNILFIEVSRHFNDTAEKLSIFKLGKIIKPVYKDATVAVIAAAGANVYYHWMIDIVPRVDLLIKSSYFNTIDYFVLDYTGLSFQKELLQKLNIDESKVIPSNGFNNFHLQARDLVIPSYVSPNDAPSVEACYFLKELFKNDRSDKKPERKLYLQRKRGRKIVNEHELLEQLYKKGFEIIHSENLSVSQQAYLFSEAKFIIAPHGAALTNLVFCEPGTKVIDIFSPEWVNPCYWILSSHLKLNYSYIIGEGKDIQEHYDPVGKNTDITVNIYKFIKLYNRVESNSNIK